jgi:Flp pilus assembly pilin Flp
MDKIIRLQEFNSDPDRDRGAAMVEYALLLILIAIVAFVAVGLVGEELSSTYGDIAACIDPNGC